MSAWTARSIGRSDRVVELRTARWSPPDFTRGDQVALRPRSAVHLNIHGETWNIVSASDVLDIMLQIAEASASSKPEDVSSSRAISEPPTLTSPPVEESLETMWRPTYSIRKHLLPRTCISAVHLRQCYNDAARLDTSSANHPQSPITTRVRTSMLSRGAASAGVSGSSKAPCGVKRVRPSSRLSQPLIRSASSGVIRDA